MARSYKYELAGLLANNVRAIAVYSLTRELYQQRGNTNFRKYSFSFRIVQFWNSLPDIVIDPPSVNSFEYRLDQFWQDQSMRFDYALLV